MIDYQAKEHPRDNGVRQAIERLKQVNELYGDVEQLLITMLRELGELTHSPFAVVLKHTLTDSEQPRYVSIAAQSQSPEGKWSSLELSGALLLDQSTKPVFDALLQRRAMVMDRASLACLNRFNSYWPSIDRAMLIPLGMNKNNRHLICIGNSSTHYHTAEVQKLWPILIHVSTQMQVLMSSTEKNAIKIESVDPSNHLISYEDDVWRKIFYQFEKNSPLAMITLNPKQLICRINEAAENLLAMSGSELLHKPIEQFLLNHKVILQSLQNTRASNMVSRIRRGMGGVLDVQLNLVSYEEQGLGYDILLIEKIESSNANQHTINMALKRFQVLATMLPMGILQTDAEWQAEYVNQRWLEITGCKIGEVHGLEWMKLFHPDEGDELLTQLHANIHGGHEFIRECQIRYEQGFKWGMLHATPIIDLQGVVTGLIATISDFSKQHEAEERLREMAEKDSLTGLSNRACFFDRLKHALDRVERHGSLALLALDLDGFKHINDTLGHDVGDFILIEVAKRLRNSLRVEDTICRVGGDEFLIVIEGLEDATIVASLAEKLLHVLEKPYQLGSKEIFISTSIGISFSVMGRKTTSKNLLKQADLALYRAKDAGRNNFQYYSPELEQVSRKKLELTNDLHRALGRQEFEAYYQAQLDVKTNKIKGFETLLRWQHPDLGLMSPVEFIPLLEESGLISSVSQWMCQQSFAQLRKWIDDGLLDENAVMAVNISPRQFYDENLVRNLYEDILYAQLSCSNVVVEVTETLLLKEHELILKHLNHLHKLKISIALDDFGTGFSSLSYLKKFPIDIIKIDRSFIKDIVSDENDAAITRAVIQLGESLGMDVLAEGVDSEQILACLKDWNCAGYQGYLVNKPLPADKIKALCLEHNKK